MGVIEKTAELIDEIIKCDEFLKFKKAKEVLDLDGDYKTILEKFDENKIKLNEELCKEKSDDVKITFLSDELRELYKKMHEIPVMTDYKVARSNFESLITNVNSMINSCKGELWEGGGIACSGSCESCRGCF